MKKIILSFAIMTGFLIVDSGWVNAQETPTPAKKASVEIKTSAVCGMCKNTIETALLREKGIKSANLEVSSKMVTVVYNPTVITTDAIRIAITLAGYDADSLAADPVAYENLHGCCKKDSHD